MAAEWIAQDAADPDVTGDQHHLVRNGMADDLVVVRTAKVHVTHVRALMTRTSDGRRERSRQILVDEEAGHSDCSKLLVGNHTGCIRERGHDVLAIDLVLAHHVVDAHPAGELADDDRDGYAGTSHDGTPALHTLFDDDARSDLGHPASVRRPSGRGNPDGHPSGAAAAAAAGGCESTRHRGYAAIWMTAVRKSSCIPNQGFVRKR